MDEYSQPDAPDDLEPPQRPASAVRPPSRQATRGMVETKTAIPGVSVWLRPSINTRGGRGGDRAGQWLRWSVRHRAHRNDYMRRYMAARRAAGGPGGNMDDV